MFLHGGCPKAFAVHISRRRRSDILQIQGFDSMSFCKTHLSWLVVLRVADSVGFTYELGTKPAITKVKGERGHGKATPQTFLLPGCWPSCPLLNFYCPSQQLVLRDIAANKTLKDNTKASYLNGEPFQSHGANICQKATTRVVRASKVGLGLLA